MLSRIVFSGVGICRTRGTDAIYPSKMLISGSALPWPCRGFGGGINVYAGYGMSETCPVTVSVLDESNEAAVEPRQNGQPNPRG